MVYLGSLASLSIFAIFGNLAIFQVFVMKNAIFINFKQNRSNFSHETRHFKKICKIFIKIRLIFKWFGSDFRSILQKMNNLYLPWRGIGIPGANQYSGGLGRYVAVKPTK